jgi:hypothetical protein
LEFLLRNAKGCLIVPSVIDALLGCVKLFETIDGGGNSKPKQLVKE